MKRPLTLIPRRIVLIGGNTIRCGKTHISKQLQNKLEEKVPLLQVVRCETSHSISMLAKTLRSYSDYLPATLKSTESIVSDWMIELIGNHGSKIVASSNKHFSKWLHTQLSIILPILGGSTENTEEYKSNRRDSFYFPVAQQILKCYGPGYLTEIAWIHSIRQHADVCIISGIRTVADCTFGMRHDALLLRVEASLIAAASRHDIFGVSVSTKMMTAPWDTQLPDYEEMYRIPNRYLLGGEEQDNKSAAQETDQALNTVVDAIMDGLHIEKRQNSLSDPAKMPEALMKMLSPF